MNDNFKDLEERVNKFNRMALPGQPLSMHMGTSYLVNDLWDKVKSLQAEIDLMKEEPRELPKCPFCGTHDEATVSLEEDHFGVQGHGLQTVVVPVWTCNVCEQRWTNWRAEEIKESYVRALLGGSDDERD